MYQFGSFINFKLIVYFICIASAKYRLELNNNDAWWCLMMLDKNKHYYPPQAQRGGDSRACDHNAFELQESCIWSSRIMYLIIKNHAFDHQESCIWSSRIMHLIIKNHACYNIMSAIASLIATYKRYALVLKWGAPYDALWKHLLLYNANNACIWTSVLNGQH